MPRHATAESGRVRGGCYDVDRPFARPLQSDEVVEPHRDQPHVPGPSLWPVGFAIGVVVLLLGIVVGYPIVILGSILAVGFGFLWVRDLTTGQELTPPPEFPTETRAARAPALPALA